MARVASLEDAQLVRMLLDGIGEAQQEDSPLACRRRRPRRRLVTGCDDGAIDVHLARFGHGRKQAAVVRVEHVDARPGGALDELATYEEPGVRQPKAGGNVGQFRTRPGAARSCRPQ